MTEQSHNQYSGTAEDHDLTRFFSAGSSFTERRGRAQLVARVRWMLLIFTSIYSICAAAFFAFSQQGLQTSALQLTVLLGSCALILAYNLFFHFRCQVFQQHGYTDQLQVFLDLLFVTVLVYGSGSASSWLWTLYLLVTLEASVLLARTIQTWAFGIFGGVLYGCLLLLGYLGVIPPVEMPFVDPDLHQQALYLFLNWLWVCVLNTAVAIAGTALMSVIRREQEALARSEAEKAAFLESAHDLIFRCDATGKFLYVNQAWQQALGYRLDELSQLSMLDLIEGGSRSTCLIEFRRALRGEESSSLEGVLVAKNGIHVTVEGSFSCTFENGKPAGIWGICRDITARKEAQEQLHHMAHHDMLTDLPNRLTFHDRLSQAKALVSREKQKLAILFLDLDRFKTINDTLGHDIGDQMLQEAANRLQSCIRASDTVARFGGDEFAILLVNPKTEEDIERIALKVLKSLAQPMTLNGNELFITTSIGISRFPQDSEDEEALLKQADIAMYQAKSLGRNTCQFYSPEMDLHAERRLILETSLRKAIDNEEFYILYQPKVDLQSGQVTALEALLRWEHPQLGLVPPNDFISLAEESGLIVPLGEWVLRKACEQNLAWQQQGLPAVRIAVNLSGFQLERADFVERVADILAETGLSGRYLEFEITETVVMQNPEFAVRILNQLKEMGIHISIDDFGTGYSSLAHLKRFSVNTLKIDKSFVDEVELSSTDAAIASAIINMGKSLNLSVIAEGVETEGQRDFLKREECHEMQGFLFSRPLQPKAVVALLKTGGVPERVRPAED